MQSIFDTQNKWCKYLAGLRRSSAVIMASFACGADDPRARDDTAAFDGDAMFSHPWVAELEAEFGPEGAKVFLNILHNTGIALAGKNDIWDGPGHVYMSRDSALPDQDIYHVGETTKADSSSENHVPAEERVRQSRRNCGRPYVLVEAFDVCHPRLAEKLIHAHLIMVQGPEAKKRLQAAGLCKGTRCPSCGVQHHEWFCVPEERVRGVIRYWCEFVYRYHEALVSDFHSKYPYLPVCGESPCCPIAHKSRFALKA
jgi:hypothetical protein